MPGIPMLGPEELTPGPHRDLVHALQELHAAAGWPSTRLISKARGDFPATLSHERVRSILSGKSLPLWPTLETLVRVLVSMRNSAPRDTETEIARFMSLWKAAKLGEYGAVEQLIHGGVAESVYGDGGQWTASDIVRLLTNPIYAIEIDPDLAFPHEPIISEEEWIAASLRFIGEVGPEAFLRTLLDILKGGWIASADPDFQGNGEDSLHGMVDADAADEYVVTQILRRLGTETNILGRSAAKVRKQSSEIEAHLESELEQLESDVNVLRQALIVSPDTWEDLSVEAKRLVLLYLIDRVTVGPSKSKSIEEQLKIEWRIPVPGEASD
jgi:hypothetical protein